ncbi:MAG: prepilin peptidase [Phycisphaerales bacterium]|nr:prepilin peptidase [Phycisphaerales bacterium]
MPDALIMILPKLITLGFIMAFGASIGSLVNVLVYRLPLGLDVVSPTSRCPKCNTKLTWRENIPIFGWLILAGKCRFCKCKISAEYPIVETFVAIIFGLIYALWYMVEPGDTLLGLPIGDIAPEWAANGILLTWPTLVILFVLMGSLVAMTIIDARTFTIPLVLTWVPALVALFFHTGHAIWFQTSKGPLTPVIDGYWNFAGSYSRWFTAPGYIWTIPTPSFNGWRFIGIILGASLGLIIANLLLKYKILTRSFADYDQWLEKHNKSLAASMEETDQAPDQAPDHSAAHEWIMYPYARREMIRELAFLAPVALLAFFGGWLSVTLVTTIAGDWTFNPTTGTMVPPTQAPLWLVVMTGVLAGYLIGGGVVWAVRILGSLLFNKEAMGLGDVHMMAAVGACMGWIDSTLAFFIAAFVALTIAGVGALAKGKISRAMPYGPSLAIATVMVLFGKPIIEWGLGKIMGMDHPFNLP